MMEFDFNTHPLTSKLKNVESAGPDKWRASCPCGWNHKHQDKNESLSVEYDRQTKTLLVYCFTGCTVDEICKATNCELSDLRIGAKDPNSFISWYAAQNGLTVVESYSYCYGPYNDGLRKIRFRKPDGSKTFCWLREDPSKKSGFAMTHNGSAHRLYVAGNINNSTVFLVEGEKDANTVHKLMNGTAVSAENGASRATGSKWLEEYTQQLAGKTVYILWDNDDIGKQFAQVEAQEIAKSAQSVFLLDLPSAWPNCPEKADITDYVNAFGQDEAYLTVASLIATAEKYTASEPELLATNETINLADPAAAAPAGTVTDTAESWEPIIKSAALPVFPLEVFPGWIQAYIRNYAATTGVNTDYCAAAVIAAVSAVIVGHCDIPFNGSHREPAQLYTAFVGGSGSMKSSVINQFFGPLRERLQMLNKNVNQDNYAIKMQIEDLEKAIAAEQKKKAPNEEQIRLDSAAVCELREKRKSGYPVPLDDITPEALVSSMKHTRGTANIASAEGNIINVLTGHSYTQRGATPNLDAFLKGYDAEPIHAFRVTTGEIDIQRADISILLAIQPGLLERLLNSSDAVGRGLAQRFIIYAPEAVADEIDHTKSVPMEPEHAERWKAHLEYLLSRYMEPDDPAKLMQLEPAADMIIRQFWNYETGLKNERGAADEDSIIGWISKLHGKALRVAAIMALLRDKDAQTITREDAQNAVDLFILYYIPQFISAYEKPDCLTRAQRFIVDWILRRAERTGERESFTEREIWNDLRQRTVFNKNGGQDQFRAALDDLQEKNYIRPITIPPASTGKRPTKAWQINPEVY